jgi:peptidoglycan hydrolase FlgJ
VAFAALLLLRAVRAGATEHHDRAGLPPLRTLDALRGRAASDPKAAAREAAKQFEALFMNELVKSMRAATLASGLLDNEAPASSAPRCSTGSSRSSSPACRAGCRRPSRASSSGRWGWRRGRSRPPRRPTTQPAPLGRAAPSVTLPQTGAAGFVQQHTRAAQVAEAATGIPAAFMVAQAAHETGWGRKEIRHADGAPSYNLFGIKAGAVEGVGGRGHDHRIRRRPAAQGARQFRAYGSYAESFADYARLMKDSPRYRHVAAAGRGARPVPAGFAQPRPAARRLRHRPGLRRQADARHQHHAAPAAHAGVRTGDECIASDVAGRARPWRPTTRRCRPPATTSPTPTWRATRASR